MTIDEAIEILYELIRINKHVAIPGHLGAMKLGIEALKAYRKGQEAGWYPPGYKLPGETKD